MALRAAGNLRKTQYKDENGYHQKKRVHELAFEALLEHAPSRTYSKNSSKIRAGPRQQVGIIAPKQETAKHPPQEPKKAKRDESCRMNLYDAAVCLHLDSLTDPQIPSVISLEALQELLSGQNGALGLLETALSLPAGIIPLNRDPHVLKAQNKLQIDMERLFSYLCVGPRRKVRLLT